MCRSSERKAIATRALTHTPVIRGSDHHGSVREKSLKHLIGRIQGDPWYAVEWKGTQYPEVASALIRFTDDAIFEGRWSDALDYSAIARRVSRKLHDPHLICRAEACSGSVLRGIDAQDFAEKKFLIADSSCTCGLCRGEVSQRWGACILLRGDFEEASEYFDRALRLLEKDEPYDEDLLNSQLCVAYLSRSCALRLIAKLRDAFRDVQRAVDYLDHEMPSRVFTSTLLNVIWIIAANSARPISCHDALDVIRVVSDEIRGCRVHSSVLPFVRWCKGLLYARLGENMRGERFIDTAIRGLIRHGAAACNITAARADRALVKSWSRFSSAEDRSIIREIIEGCGGEFGDEALFSEAIGDPTPDNILRWRDSLESPVPGISLGVASEEDS